MPEFNYRDLKNDIADLVAETERYGSSVMGAFGRAFVEYWLDSEVLAEVYPTPRPMKLMVVVAIFAQMKERGIALDEDALFTAQWLANNLSINDLASMFSREDILLMLTDAEETLPEDFYRLVERKFAPLRA